jgi:hypothetical protein
MLPPVIEEPGMSIGVIDAQSNPDFLMYDEPLPASTRSWLYSCHGALASSESVDEGDYGLPFSVGQDIMMEISFDTGGDGAQIRYFVNGVDQGVAFSGLRGVRLIPAVSLFGRSDAVELQAYQGTGQPTRPNRRIGSIMFGDGGGEEEEDSDGDDEFPEELLHPDGRPPARFVSRSPSTALSGSIAPPSPKQPLAGVPCVSVQLYPARRSEFMSMAAAESRVTRSHGAEGLWKLVMAGSAVSVQTSRGAVHRWSIRVCALEQPAQLWIGLVRGDTSVENPMQGSNFGWGLFGDGSLGTLSCNDRTRHCPALYEGDTVDVLFDTTLRELRFEVNGRAFGAAYSPARPVTPAWTPETLGGLFVAVALRYPQDSVSIAPAGMMGTSICMPPMLDLHKLLVATAARMAGTVTTGLPLLPVEEQLQPWLETPLLLSDFHDAAELSKLTDHLAAKSAEVESDPALLTSGIPAPALLPVPEEFSAAGPYTGAVWQAVNARMNKLCKSLYSTVFGRMMVFSQIVSAECELLFVAALAHQLSVLPELRALFQQPDTASVPDVVAEIWLGLMSFRRWLKQQQQSLVDGAAADVSPPASQHPQPAETAQLAESKDEELQQESKDADVDQEIQFNRGTVQQPYGLLSDEYLFFFPSSSFFAWLGPCVHL